MGQMSGCECVMMFYLIAHLCSLSADVRCGLFHKSSSSLLHPGVAEIIASVGGTGSDIIS